MQFKREIANGKNRIIIISSASGIDKTKDAVKYVMGDGYEYRKDQQKQLKGGQAIE